MSFDALTGCPEFTAPIRRTAEEKGTMRTSPKDEATSNGSAELGDVTLTEELRAADSAMRAAHRRAAAKQGKNPLAPEGTQ